jgi:hypothetical protein
MFSKNKSTSKKGDDLWPNPFEERKNDENHQVTPQDSLHVSFRFITRLGAKKIKEASNGLIQGI